MFASMPRLLLDYANNECGPAYADGSPPYYQEVDTVGLCDDWGAVVLKLEIQASRMEGSRRTQSPFSQISSRGWPGEIVI